MRARNSAIPGADTLESKDCLSINFAIEALQHPSNQGEATDPSVKWLMFRRPAMSMTLKRELAEVDVARGKAGGGGNTGRGE